MPKYDDIATVLRQRIIKEKYPPGSLLPNQTDLVSEFQVSRMTIKKALDILASEGLISSQRGAGTRVLNHFWSKDSSPVDEYQGLSAQMAKENRDLRSQVISFEVCFPSEALQKYLTITATQPVYKIIRLRILEGQPYIIEHTYMPVDLVSGLTEEILKNSIYTYLREELGFQIAGAFRSIQADKSDELDQKYLHCKLDDPVLEVEQVVYLQSGRPFEYSRSRNRYDVRSYSVLDVKN